MTLTATEYAQLERAYDWLNSDLFAGRLPACLITLQREKNARGYFSPQRFASRHQAGELTDELALNPSTFNRPDIEILSTLAHEMAHVWQEHNGSPSRNGYHNREWAAKMVEIGLMPSHNGQPGGKTTGQSMTHYILPGGLFEKSALALLATGFVLNWQSRENPPGAKPRKESKVKYTCEVCGQNAWAKPGARLACGECSTPRHLVPMEPEESEEDPDA